MKRVGIVKDKIFLEHFAEHSHPENPERLHAVNQMLAQNDLLKDLVIVPPKTATFEDISLIHSPQYIRKIEETQNNSFSELDGDTYASKSTYEAALLAAGSLLNCVEKVSRGELNSAFGFVRPPGHHAEKDKAMGFCIFNNAAIAAAYAHKKLGIKRIAIVDFDTHHGNGTQNAFWDTDEILFISSHQFPYYPGTGSINEIGVGKGKGFNVNIPLPVGFGDDEYSKIYKEIVSPILSEFNPSLIIVSAGFDVYSKDPLGGMQITSSGFKIIGETLRLAAEKSCEGKIIYTLEGGYSPTGIQEGSNRILQTLLSDKIDTTKLSNDKISKDANTAIEKIKNHVKGYWSL